MLQRPQSFDELVTEVMSGDILSDLAAGLIGGLGMVPSADLGDQFGVYQPCHGLKAIKQLKPGNTLNASAKT